MGQGTLQFLLNNVEFIVLYITNSMQALENIVNLTSQPNLSATSAGLRGKVFWGPNLHWVQDWGLITVDFK